MNDASPRLTERGRQRRRAMLDAATQAFLEHGFEGTTLDMVIERAGGSRGTLYSSFGGKEGLFAAVIAHMIEEIFDDSADQPRPAATLSATLEHFGRRFLTSLLDPRCQSLYRLVVAESPRFPAIGKSFYEQGPQQSYLLLSERLAAVAPHMDEETLYAVACQFLEMLQGRPVPQGPQRGRLPADHGAAGNPPQAVGGHHRLLPGTPVAEPRAGLSDAPIRRRAAAPGPAVR